MKPKFKMPKKKPGKNIKLVFFGVLAFVLLIALLGVIVYKQNEEQCQEFGLKGGLFSCKIDKKYEFASIAFVAGNTANTPMPVLTKTTKKLIQNSVDIEDSVVEVFSATPSHPRISLKDNKSNISDSDDIAIMREKAENRIDAVNSAIQSAPTENGAAYLDAIIRAGRSALNKAIDFDGGKAAVVVIGSGLSDSGILNFADQDVDLINRTPSEIIQKLKENEVITDRQLSGLTIYWSGLGEVTSPQAELSDAMREKLETIYTEILEEAGAKVRGFSPIESGETKSVNTQFTVKPVNVTGSGINWGGAIDENSKLFFEANSDVFAAGSEPQLVLQPYISEMKSNGSIKAQIVGYVAKLTCSDTVPDDNLAIKRANAVRQFMIEAGINGDRISTKSGGFGEEDECAGSSRPNEEVRKRNRKIVINKI